MTMMKSSNTEWLGDIPAEWDVAQIGNYYELRNEKVSDYDFEPLSVTMKGIVPQLATAAKSDDHSNRKLVKKGDFVINSRSDRRGSCGISPLDGSVSLINIVMEPRGEMNPQYYNWLFHTEQFADEFYKWGHGIVDDLWTTRWQEMKKILIVAPSPDEQQAIADYLDETCSKIDEIIAEAKASIDEYEKLKQATIDENILGYDSVHIKLRQLGSLKNGLNFSHSDDVANIKFLGVGCFKDNMILSEVDDFADEHIDFEISEEYLLSNGDIVFVRSNGSKELVGRSIMVENIDYPVTFSGFCIRFRNMHIELVDNRFLLYYFRTTHFKQSLLKYSNDSTNINNLNQEMLNAIRINAPVIAEQKLLVKKMEEQVFVFDSLIAEKESLINDLEAYKKSLIYEVVTGKRRVV